MEYYISRSKLYILHGECTVNPLDTDIVWQTIEQEMFKLMHERIGIGLASPVRQSCKNVCNET